MCVFVFAKLVSLSGQVFQLCHLFAQIKFPDEDLFELIIYLLFTIFVVKKSTILH